MKLEDLVNWLTNDIYQPRLANNVQLSDGVDYFYLFDDNEWKSDVTTIPYNTMSASLVAISEDELLLFAGVHNKVSINYSYTYSMSTNQWERKGDLPYAG